MQLQQIPIDQLKVSALNMRHARKAPDVSDILPSIRKRGVIQSLRVRREGKKYGVIAGRRRLYALRQVAKETGAPLKAPCIIEDDSDADAIEASVLENVARLEPGEFQQYDAFARMAAENKSVAEIAETFGVTELKVNRILALANLLPEIKTLYEDEAIAASTLRALTLASADQQKEWLALFHSEDEHAPNGEHLKSWLTGGERISTKVALFDLDKFDGVFLSDLFAEESYFQDPDLFWAKQSTAIADRIDAYTENGWSEVVVLERGVHFCSWDYGKRTKTQGGKVFVEVRHTGAVTFHEGYLTTEDIKKIDAIIKGAPDPDKPASSDKPELSGPLTEYVDAHRCAAIRSSLLDNPKIALRLIAAHMLAGSSLWRVEPETLKCRKETTRESIKASTGETRFQKEQADLFSVLGFERETPEQGKPAALVWQSAMDVFGILIDQDEETILKLLTIAMAASLKAGTDLIEMLPHLIDVDMTALWSPDDAFFDLLRDKRVINAMVGEIATPAVAKSCLTETGKSQKEIIRNRINGIGVDTAQTDWRPRWMTDPETPYVSKKASLLAKRASAAKAALPSKPTS